MLLCSFKGVMRFTCSGFKIQRRPFRVNINTGIKVSCQDMFKKLQILPFYSQYIYCLLMFVVKNRSLFKLNSDIYGFSTRYDNEFCLPSANIKLFEKGVFHSRIKTYNHPPQTIKELSHDVKQFRLALKRIIILNPFYSLEEYFEINWK
jgi:hypothetical protein